MNSFCCAPVFLLSGYIAQSVESRTQSGILIYTECFIVVVSLNSSTDKYLSYSLLTADSKSKNLTWRKHIEDTSTMVNKTLGFVHRNLSECISQVKYVAYNTFEPRHEISNKVVCATSKASDQPAHTRSLIRAFASRLNIL